MGQTRSREDRKASSDVVPRPEPVVDFQSMIDKMTVMIFRTFDRAGCVLVLATFISSACVAILSWEWFPVAGYRGYIARIPPTGLNYFVLLAPWALLLAYLIMRRIWLQKSS